MSRLVALVAAGLMLGCATPKDPTMSTPMTSKSGGSFVDGPALSPPADLLAWLENDVAKASERKLIRLPVVAVWEDEYRLSFSDVFVGTATPAADDAIHLSLDDGGMGVGIIDTLAGAHPDGASVAVWLEGYWGELVAMPDFGIEEEGPKAWPFAVLSVGDPLSGDESHAQIVAD